MSVHQHEDLLRLIQDALVNSGKTLQPYECEKMQRFLVQLDSAIEENGGPKRVAQVIAAFSEDVQVRCA